MLVIIIYIFESSSYSTKRWFQFTKYKVMEPHLMQLTRQSKFWHQTWKTRYFLYPICHQSIHILTNQNIIHFVSNFYQEDKKATGISRELENLENRFVDIIAHQCNMKQENSKVTEYLLESSETLTSIPMIQKKQMLFIPIYLFCIYIVYPKFCSYELHFSLSYMLSFSQYKIYQPPAPHNDMVTLTG